MVEITEQDITLRKFLKKFTLTADQTPGNKIVLPNSDFMLIASILKLNLDLREFRRPL